MKKLAMALMCLVSVAFFASCDPQPVVEHPEPAISVIDAEGYLQNGDVLDLNELGVYGFRCASNAETQVELAKFVLTIDGEVWYDSIISGTEFTFEDEIFFELDEKEIIGSCEIIGTVTDADGKSNQAIIKIDVNQSEDLLALPFQWVRKNGADGTGLDGFGLQWTRNVKEVFAVIEPIPGEEVTMYSIPAEKWDEIQTISDKAALFSDGGAATPITDYRGVSMAATHNYDDVIATCYDGVYFLLHITKCTVEERAWVFTIDGEVK